MAKKYEFKPDKPYSNWLSKLYLTQKQRRSLLKWSLYGLVLLVLCVLQDTVLWNARIFGAAPDLVPCAIFMICMLEGSHTGSVFTLVSACLYVFSGSSPGVFSIVLITFYGVGVTLLRQAYLQKGFGVAVICCAIAVLAYEMTLFVAGVFLGLTLWNRAIGFLITAGLSAIAAPIFYPICLAIGKIGGETWNE